MRTKISSQKGFGVIEGILVVAILGIIGGVGFYVYNANQETNKSLDNTGNSEVSKVTKKEKDPDPYEGWKDYDLRLSGRTLKYPGEWKVTVPYAGTSSFERIGIESPDLKTEQLPIGATSVIDGAEIGLSINTNPESKTIEEFKAGDALSNRFGRKKTEFIKNGITLLSLELEYESPNTLYTIFYIDSAEYTVTINKSAYDKSNHKEIYDKVIGSLLK